MKVVVCVESSALGRASRAAVAAALGLGPGASVTAVSAGATRDGQNSALAETRRLGVDRTVQVLDRALADPDVLTLGRALAAALSRLGPDLILTGAQSDDEGSGVMAAAIAHHLDFVVITRAEDIAVDLEHPNTLLLTVRGGGSRRRLRVRLPAVVSIKEGVRRAPLPEKSGAIQDAPQVWTLADLGTSPTPLPPRPDTSGALVPFSRKPVAVTSAAALVRRGFGP